MDLNAQRYRDALQALQEAASVFKGHPLYGVLLNDADDGNLDWSAVHTFISNILDLNMTADQSLADLNGAPTGALQQPIQPPQAPQEPFPPITGVPDQPQP